MNITLNEADRSLYEMIENYIFTHGYTPSYHEMSLATGMSKSTVCYHMRRLQIYGLIQSDAANTSHRAFRLATVQLSPMSQVESM